jgi:hypothetical protein
MMIGTVNPVEAIQRRNRITPARKLDVIDSQKFRSQSNKKQMNSPSQYEDKTEDTQCEFGEAIKHFDCKA